VTLLSVSSPGDVATYLTGRDYLSYSAVSTFQACPLRYFFKYRQGLSERFVSSSLVFGSAIHSAIEIHYREQMRGIQKPPLELLRQVYREKWTHFGSQSIRFGKEEDRASLDVLSNRVLTTFQSSDLAQHPGTILGIEEELRGDLIPGCPEILARVDLLRDAGDALVLTDFKTSRARWSEEQVEESAGQLLLYHDLVKPLADGRPVRLEFAVITKTKIPTLVRHPVPVDFRDVERMKRVVHRVWTAIQTGLFYPSPSPLNCGGCPFREPCREWMG
jgi:putative RecB family exonuclease